MSGSVTDCSSECLPTEATRRKKFENLRYLLLEPGEYLLIRSARTRAGSGSKLTQPWRFDLKTATYFALTVLFAAAATAQETPTVNRVLNAASLTLPGGASIAPGSLVSIFGSGMAGAPASASTNPLPATLGGVSVTFNGLPAAILYVSPGQINVQAPWALLEIDQQERTVPVVVTRDGRASAPFSATVARYSPALFTVSQFGSGPAVALNAADGSFAHGVGALPGRMSRPARHGSVIAIYGNGLGGVAPSIPTGQVSPDIHRRTMASVEVLIGGRPAEVLFAGLTGNVAGANHLNVVVPADVPAGQAVPVQVRVGGVTSSAQVTIAVEAGMTPTPALPEANGRSIWDYLTLQNFRQNFKLWPGQGQQYEGVDPHGMLLTTYVNQVAFNAIGGRMGTMPAGSLIVKENYMPDRTLAATTLMYKVSGFDSENGDWFYSTRRPDGTIANEGRVAGCSGCHKLAAGNDYLYIGSIVPPPAPNGPAVRDFLAKQNYQKAWRRWPGTSEFTKSGAPHGDSATIYVNQIAREGIMNRTGKLSAGSMIVKENYTPDKTLAALTVMYKSPGYDPANNDWYWQMQMPDGSIPAQGRLQDCINCHRGMADNDLLFTGSTAAAPDPKAASVWEHLQQQSYQKNWKLMPGTQAMAAGTQPHGSFVTTYVNPTALDAINAKRPLLPPGSIVVKENYMPDRTLAAITVMLKSEGYDPDHNDWYWLQRTATGTVAAEGRVRGCYTCHATVAKNDYLYLAPAR